MLSRVLSRTASCSIRRRWALSPPNGTSSRLIDRREEASPIVGLDTVAWTRGAGCAELAAALGATSPHLEGDRRAACIHHKVDALVTRRLTGFDLVSTIVPDGVDLARTDTLVAAVGPGPHSRMAVDVAARLADRLGVKAAAIAVVRPDESPDEIGTRLEKFVARSTTEVEPVVVPGASALDLLGSLSREALLVVGAPGGSWFQRQLFGPGHRLIAKAPGGTLVVRSSPRRCFHLMSDATGFVIGPHMRVADAVAVMNGKVAAVADGGRLVGLVRVATLDAGGTSLVGAVMEPPVSVGVDEPTDVVDELCAFLDHDLVPVTDRDGSIVGVIRCDGAEG